MNWELTVSSNIMATVPASDLVGLFIVEKQSYMAGNQFFS
jgi:hypothetical protein